MEYYTAQYILNSINTHNVPTGVKSLYNFLTLREIPIDILYFLGDLIFTFFPMAIKILHELNIKTNKKNDPKSKICKQNTLNILNFARNFPTILKNIEIENLYYISSRINNLTISNSHFGNIYLKKSNIKEFKIESSIIESFHLFKFHANSVNFLELTTKHINIVDSEFEVRARNCSLKNISIFSSILGNSSFSSSIIKITKWKEVNLRNVTFIGNIIYSNDDKYLIQCDLKDVIFEKCIFIGLNFDVNNLFEASFKKCTFISCSKSSEESLHTLNGSSGYFICKPKGKNYEVENRPYLWNSDKKRKVVKGYTNFLGEGEIKYKREAQIDKEKAKMELIEKKIEYLKKLKIPNRLAIAFRNVDLNSKSLSVDMIRTKAEACHSNIEYLVRNDLI